MKYYLISRFKEMSTWQAIAFSLTAFGIIHDQDKAAAIAALGFAVAGGMGIFLPDTFSKK